MNHQPQQLEVRIPAIEGETEEAYAARIEATLRGHGIDPASLVPISSDELLTKVLPAGGPLLGQEPCPSCGHFPGEPRDNPFRRCATCGGAA